MSTVKWGHKIYVICMQKMPKEKNVKQKQQNAPKLIRGVLPQIYSKKQSHKNNNPTSCGIRWENDQSPISQPHMYVMTNGAGVGAVAWTLSKTAFPQTQPTTNIGQAYVWSFLHLH